MVGYNGSDVTYGWNGRMSGFTLHYSHFTDVIEEHGHAFPLSPGLIPIGLVSSWNFRQPIDDALIFLENIYLPKKVENHKSLFPKCWEILSQYTLYNMY